MLYIRMPDGAADERGFAALRQIAGELPAAQRVGLSRFKEIVRDQFLILRLDEERAIAALPKLLPGTGGRERPRWGCSAASSRRAARRAKKAPGG